MLSWEGKWRERSEAGAKIPSKEGGMPRTVVGEFCRAQWRKFGTLLIGVGVSEEEERMWKG